MKKTTKKSILEYLFLAQMRDEICIPEPVQEYKFHHTRRFRFDFAWPSVLIAAEVQGGQWVTGGGRHQRGAHLDNEYEKLNLAAMGGWRVFLFTTNMVEDGRAIATLKEFFEVKGDEQTIEMV
jgi:hypothetical protein